MPWERNPITGKLVWFHDESDPRPYAGTSPPSRDPNYTNHPGDPRGVRQYLPPQWNVPEPMGKWGLDAGRAAMETEQAVTPTVRDIEAAPVSRVVPQLTPTPGAPNSMDTEKPRSGYLAALYARSDRRAAQMAEAQQGRYSGGPEMAEIAMRRGQIDDHIKRATRGDGAIEAGVFARLINQYAGDPALVEYLKGLRSHYFGGKAGYRYDNGYFVPDREQAQANLYGV